MKYVAMAAVAALAGTLAGCGGDDKDSGAADTAQTSDTSTQDTGGQDTGSQDTGADTGDGGDTADTAAAG